MRGPGVDLLAASAIFLTTVAASTSEGDGLRSPSAILDIPSPIESVYPGLDSPSVMTPFRSFATEATIGSTPILFRLQRRSSVLLHKRSPIVKSELISGRVKAEKNIEPAPELVQLFRRSPVEKLESDSAFEQGKKVMNDFQQSGSTTGYTYKIPPVEKLKEKLDAKQEALNNARGRGDAEEVVKKLQSRVKLADDRVKAVEEKDLDATVRVKQHHYGKGKDLLEKAVKNGPLETKPTDFVRFHKNLIKGGKWEEHQEKLKLDKNLQKLHSI